MLRVKALECGSLSPGFDSHCIFFSGNHGRPLWKRLVEPTGTHWIPSVHLGLDSPGPKYANYCAGMGNPTEKNVWTWNPWVDQPSANLCVPCPIVAELPEFNSLPFVSSSVICVDRACCHRWSLVSPLGFCSFFRPKFSSIPSSLLLNIVPRLALFI